MKRFWKRLGIFEIERRPLRDRLIQLASDLDANAEISKSRRRRNETASYLRRLANNPKALKAIEAKVGRSRSERRPDIALDYLVCRTLLGKGKFQQAKELVADAWSTGEKNVEGCFDEYGVWAEKQLAEILCDRDTDQTESETLHMISADLRDMHGLK